MTRSIRVASVRRFQRPMPGVSERLLVYSLPEETIVRPLFAPLGRASHSLRSSRRTTRIRHDVTSGRNVCAGRTVVAWKGTLLRDPPRREDGAKTSFVRLFRGKVFRDESTHFARTNDARVRGSGS